MAETRLLIVDDDVGICETLSDIFQEKGFGVATAGTGGEAVELAGQAVFDAALIDIQLPDTAGIELLAPLKEVAPGVVMIMITAHASVETAVRALNEGASAYITKPLNMDEVFATLRVALEKRRLNMENRRLVRDVQRELAERKKTEEALRENETKYKNLIYNTPGMVYFGYPDWSANLIKGYEEICGYTEEELNSKDGHWLSVIHPDDKERVIAGGLELTKNQKDLVQTYRIITKAGDIRWIEDRKTALFSQEGAYLGVHGVAFDITEPVLAETERRRVFDLPTTLIMIAGSDTTIVRVSAGWEHLLGYSPEEMVGRSFFDFIHPDDIPESQDEMESLVEGEITYTFDNRYRHKDGTFRVMMWSASTDPETGRVYGLAQDITERKKAEKEILRQSKLLEGINKVLQEALTCESVKEIGFTCLAVAEALTGSKFGFIGEMNPAGLFDTTAISNPGWDACKMPDSDATILTQNMEISGIDRSTIRDETSRIVNDPASHPDRVGVPEGHPPITSFLGVPLKHAGETIGMIGLGNKESGYDLVDQRNIETLSVAFVEALMRKRAEMAFRAEEDKFRVLVEESPLGFVSIGEGGVYEYVNPKFIELFGYTLEEVPDGREWFRRAHPDPEYRSQVISAWTDELNAAKRGASRPHKFSVTCKDGSEKVIQFIVVMMKTGGQFVICEDLTEQRKLENQFRQSQKMEGVGRLAGGIAHDFNNLLTIITGYAELMSTRVDKDSPLLSDLEHIFKASERAARLTNQLLAFSRKQLIQPVVLNINHAIAEMEKMLRRIIGEDIDLSTMFEPELWNIELDPTQMDQLFMNLAVNARDAMPNGGRLTIETANVNLDETYARQHGLELKAGPFVMFAVSDTGMGMDEETRSHVFEPFYTTKEKGKGTGLGLSTAYGIVKQSGGCIWVYSEPDQGTTFKVYFPKTDEETAFAVSDQKPAQNLEGSETILLAEDEDATRKLISSVLQEYGYSVLEARDGKEALQLIEQHKGSIHLLLSDVVMPGMSGRELAERLQLLQPEMQVLYMSGYTDNAIVHHGILEKGVLFIQKPFSPKALVSKVRNILDMSPAPTTDT